MIKTALKFLVDTYNNQNVWIEGTNHKLVLGNIGFREQFVQNGQGTPLANGITADLRLSLISVDEERILKNTPHIRRSALSHEYKKPPLYANLYLLITANYGHEGNTHEDGLEALSRVVAFFQERPILAFREYSNSLSADVLEKHSDLQIEMELQSMSLEEIYHLWGVLGGKILPSVMYRARIVPIEEDRLAIEGKPIENIRTKLPASEEIT